MKKYVVTSLVVVASAACFGTIVGLSVRQPAQTQLIQKTAVSATAPTTTETTAPTTTAQTTAPTTIEAPKATAATTSSPSADTTAPAPVTVTAFQQIPLDSNGNIDCELTYSDGTTYQWHWQVLDPQGSWETDSFGNNGHWVAATHQVNSCDASVIGTAKS